VLAFLVFFITSFIFHKKIIWVFLRIIDDRLAVLTITEGFMVVINVSFISGIVLASPVILYNMWKFLSEGLSNKEGKKVLFYLPLSFALFIFGVLLAYFIIAPLGIKFLVQFSEQYFDIVISAKSFINFIVLLILFFGIIFQLPIIMLFLNSVGILSKETIRTNRKYFYLVAFIVGAFFTPPDLFTQVCLAIPIIILFEITNLLIMFKQRK